MTSQKKGRGHTCSEASPGQNRGQPHPPTAGQKICTPPAGEPQTSSGQTADPLTGQPGDAGHVFCCALNAHLGVMESPTCSSHRSLTEIKQEENQGAFREQRVTRRQRTKQARPGPTQPRPPPWLRSSLSPGLWRQPVSDPWHARGTAAAADSPGRGHELCGDPGCTTEQERAQVRTSRRNRSWLWLFSGHKEPP